MLNGAAVMDAALLLVAGNESCPQPQTSEHLAAVDIMKLSHLIVVQNKIDLVKETSCAEQYKEIVNFVRGTIAEGAPIVPISAQLGYNIDVLLVWRRDSLCMVTNCLGNHGEDDPHPSS